MGFVETKMINSDFLNEPINHLNYIESIENHGSSSYIFCGDKISEKRRHDFIAKSSILFAHEQTHQALLEKLTGDDWYYFFKGNPRAGDCLNMLLNVTCFSSGNFNDMCEYMNMTSINTMPDTILHGFGMLIEEYLESDGAISWINERFSVDLSEYDDIPAVIASADGWKKILKNNSLMSSITTSQWFTEKVVETRQMRIWKLSTQDYYDDNGTHYTSEGTADGKDITPDALELMKTNNLVTEDHLTITDSAYQRLKDALYWFAQNESVTALKKCKDILSIFCNDEKCCKFLTEHTDILADCLDDLAFASAIFNSTLARDTINSSANAKNVFNTFITNIQSSNTTLNGISSDFTTITNAIKTIHDTDGLKDTTSLLTTELSKMNIAINDYKSYISVMNNLINLMSSTDAEFFENLLNDRSFVTWAVNDEAFVNTMVNNEMMSTALCANNTAWQIACNSQTYSNGLQGSNTAITTMLGNENARNTAISSKASMDAMAGSNYAMSRLVADNNALSKIISTQSALSSVCTSKIAMTNIINNDTALTTVVNSKSAMDSIANNNVSLQHMLSSKKPMDYINSSNVALTSLINNTISMNFIVSSPFVMNYMKDSESMIDAVLTSDSAIKILVNNNTAMNYIIQSSYFYKLLDNASSLHEIVYNDTIYSLCMNHQDIKSLFMSKPNSSAKVLAKLIGLNADDYNSLTDMLTNESLCKNYIKNNDIALDLLCSYSYALSVISSKITDSSKYNHPTFVNILSNRLLRVMYNHAALCESYLGQIMDDVCGKNYDNIFNLSRFLKLGGISTSSATTNLDTTNHKTFHLYCYYAYQDGFTAGVRFTHMITGNSAASYELKSGRSLTSIHRFASNPSFEFMNYQYGADMDMIFILINDD